MAPERQETNVPVAGIVAVLLVVTSALIPPHGLLLSSRPGGVSLDRSIFQASNVQDVDARLWEDPFDAVHRHRREASKASEGKKATDGKVSGLLEQKNGQLRPSDERPVAVLAAMVFGGPYPEDAEHRRRMRYATLSALKVSGYIPDGTEHIGFIELSHKHRWLGANEPLLPRVVPYEWFSADRPPRSVPRRLLVLWLDETAFRDKPLTRLDSMLCRVLAGTADPCSSTPPPALPIVVLGPAGSDSLQAMVTEIDASTQWSTPRWLAGAAIYSPTTTMSAASLPMRGAETKPPEDSEAALSTLFEKHHIQLVRVAVPDTTVMFQLVKELGYRRVDLTQRDDERDCWSLDHVALISEWDTAYGRSLPNAFKAALPQARRKANGKPGDQLGCKTVHQYSYMRGLDGTVYRPAAAADADKKDKDDTKPTAPDDKRERAEGNGQIDYLRRLATRLRDEDRQRQHSGRGRIRAIGVLGSDVYDKLMILQAVRDDFPDAVLFTTDLDARLVQPGEFTRTRNLIVASGYGLQLHQTLQDDIAPFRNTDQTATFLATRLATERLAQGSPEKVSEVTLATRRTVEDWKATAQVFEIGRTGALEMRRAAPTADCTSLSNCKDPRPPVVGYYVNHFRPGVVLTVPFAATLGLGLLLLTSWTVRTRAEQALAATARCLRRRRPLFSGLVVLSVALAGVAVWVMIRAVNRDDAEPFALLEGVSVWPTEMIRLVALVVAAGGLRHAWHRLTCTRTTLTERFFPAEAVHLKRSHVRGLHVLSWRGLRRIFAGPEPPTQPFKPAGEWGEYVFQASTGGRITRVAAMTLVFLGVGVVLVRGVFRAPYVPVRGQLTAIIDQVLLWPVIILVLVTLFLIVDEIRLCDKFSGGLARDTVTDWPNGTLTALRREREVSDEILSRWIDVRLIADWTKAVEPLVYLPAVVIVLMLIARSSLLDAWDMPFGLLLVFGLSAVYTLACSLTLRRVAERTRGGCMKSLDDSLFRASGQPDANRALIERLKLLRQEIEAIREGAFVPFTQQPVVRAILLAISSGAGLVVTQYLVTR